MSPFVAVVWLPHDDEVAVEDPRVDHRVALHAQQEVGARRRRAARAARRTPRRSPRRAAARPRRSRRRAAAPASAALARRSARRGGAARELERARLRRVAPEIARPLEVREVRVHRRRRREPDALADLPHGRRVAVPVDVVDEEVPDLLLSTGQHTRLQGRVTNVCSPEARDSSGRSQTGATNKARRDAGPRECAGEDLNLHGLKGH